MAHWDTLDSGISNAVLSFTSNDNKGPVVEEGRGVRTGKANVSDDLFKYIFYFY